MPARPLRTTRPKPYSQLAAPTHGSFLPTCVHHQPVPASREEMAGPFAPSASIWSQSIRHDSEDEQVAGAGAGVVVGGVATTCSG